MSWMTNIILPYNYTPLAHQREVFWAVQKGYKRIIQVWHRRGGKDLTDFNIVTTEMFKRPINAWHIFPTYTQGKKALWNAKTKDGVSYRDCVPPMLVDRVNNQEMMLSINSANGIKSMYQVVGADKPDALRGAGPAVAVLSEYSIMSPTVWTDIVQPMLLENNGIAIFNLTPMGENHAYELVEMAKNNPDWFVSIKTINDTGIITERQIDELRKQGTPEEIIQQEYYCSFKGAINGAYYAQQVKWLEDNGRFTSVPYDGAGLVDTIWDLGISDSTTIWFRQRIGKEWHYIDYYENSGEGLAHYIGYLHSKGYQYGRHYGPHDIEMRELGTGKTRIETAREMGINFDVTPRLSIADGIEAVRQHLPSCWFDKEKCKNGIAGLKAYRKEWDDKYQVFKSHPLHDWSSHAADSMRYSAITANVITGKPFKQPKFTLA